MKDLRKDVNYDLSNCSDEQLEMICDWLVKNDKGWNEVVIKKLKKEKEYISYDCVSSEFAFISFDERKTICATTLFEDLFETMRKSTLEELSKFTSEQLISYYEKELELMNKYALNNKATEIDEIVKKKVKEIIKGDDMPINYNLLKSLYKTEESCIRISEDAFVDKDNSVRIDDMYFSGVKTWGDFRALKKLING